VRADHEVLMVVDDKSTLIIGDPQGILVKQLRPHPIHSLNMIVKLINYELLSNFVKYVFKIN
jgi:hypothetical protein